MTETERINLQAQYCAKIIQEMSEKERISFAYNVLMDSFTNHFTEEGLLEEIKENHPELLTIDVEAESECS